jgi:SAC3/GANP family
MNDSSSGNAATAITGDDQRKLEALKAKLAEKKKKLLEKQQREAQSRGNASPPRTTASSGDEDDDADNNNYNSAPPIPSSQRSAFPSRHDLVARNELRFGSANASAAAAGASDRTTTMAIRKPAAPISASAAAAASTSQVAPTEREDLSSAVSLVGTCMFMCPEEELERRQRESDIQLLEIPNPAIYPSHYTLRDTVVKRFRRSAADYKLDVPEWVRPADVLETVCGYLEEWVMVRTNLGVGDECS